jgi:argininosuccinate lyase
VLALGSAAVAGTSLPIDRDDVARRLDFGAVAANSIDVSSDRDFVIEFAFVLALVAEHLSTWAEEWVLWSTAEFNYLKLPEAFCTGSSIMPQKVNPDVLELIRGRAARVIGDLTALLVLVKGLPLAYNRDLQEDKEPAFDTADHLAGSLEITKLCVETARANGKAMESAADESWVCATELAEALARKGIAFHRAHQVVGALVLDSVRKGKRPGDLTAEDLRAAAPEFDAESLALLSARRALENHTPPGGTAPASVAQALREAEERLGRMRRTS